MAKDAYIRTRTDSTLKASAEEIFSRLGLNMSDAINLFLAQVTLRDGLPFEVRLPNADTLAAPGKGRIQNGCRSTVVLRNYRLV